MPEGRKEKESNWTSVKIPAGLADSIERFLETAKARELGYISKADVVTAAVRQLLDLYRPLLRPRLEHLNMFEDHVTIKDNEQNRIVDVYFKGGRVYCSLCDSESCNHTGFALSIPEVLRILEKKGVRPKAHS